MKTFVLLFSLVILWSCEKDLAVLPDNDLETANKQADARVASDEASLYIVPAIHPSERIAIGWDLPSNAYLLSLVIKNEWDGSIISPGLLELLPVEVSLPSTGTYSITLNYKDRIGIDTKSVTIYYHYDASNPSASGVVSGVQKPECSHDFSGLRPYAVVQIIQNYGSYTAIFDISYTGNANYKAIVTDVNGNQIGGQQDLVNRYPTSQVDTTLYFELYTVGAFVFKIYSKDCELQNLCTDYRYINFHNTVVYPMGDIEYFASPY